MKKHIATIVVAVIVGAASFYGGLKYGSARSSAAPGQNQSQFGNFTGRGTGQRFISGGGFVSGQVTSKDNQSLTVETRDGGSKVVLLPASTTVLKSTNGALDDIVQGSEVTVAGTQNSDGSFTAQSVQIRSPLPANQAPR